MTRGLVVALIALGYAAGLTGTVTDISEESASALLLAKALASGHGYRAIWMPGNPTVIGIPCGLPLLLAPVVAWRGLDLWAIQLVMTAIAVAALVVVGRLLSVVGAHTPILTLTAAALLPSVVAAADQVNVALPSLACSALALYGIERWRAVPHDQRWLWVSGTATGVAVLLHPIGTALWLAAVLRLIGGAPAIRSTAARWRRAIAFTACAAAVPAIARWCGVPVAWPTIIGASAWEGVPLRIVQGAEALGRMVMPSWRAGLTTDVVAGGMLLLALAGWTMRARRQASALEIAVVCYLVWWGASQASQPQLLVAVAPFVVYYVIEGAGGIGSWCRRWAWGARAVRTAGLAAAAIWLGVNALLSAEILLAKRSGHFLSADDRHFVAAHLWAAEHLPTAVVVASDRPAVSAFISHRYAVGWPSERATHVAVREDVAVPDRWRLMTTFGSTRLYEVVRVPPDISRGRDGRRRKECQERGGRRISGQRHVDDERRRNPPRIRPSLRVAAEWGQRWRCSSSTYSLLSTPSSSRLADDPITHATRLARDVGGHSV